MLDDYAEYLADRGHQVVGVDSSPDMLGRARSRVPSGQFLLGGLNRLPVPDGSVDLVVSALALSHVPTLTPVMAEFARVLCPGGHMALSDVHHELVIRGSVPHALGPNGRTRTGAKPPARPRRLPPCRVVGRAPGPSL